jgi:diguanylate cyclase (GGDEF)-like protein/PAS domain S-box-containing protein
VETVHRHSDGSALTIRVSAAAMDEGYVLVCVDETARWRAEQHFATVVTTLAEGVIVVGKSGVIESANPAAQTILGLEGADIIQSDPLHWPIWDENGAWLPEEKRPFERARFHGIDTESQTIAATRPDGQGLWVDVTTRALTPGDDPPYAVVMSFTDITERRRQNEVLRYQASHDELTGLLNRKGINDHLAALPDQPCEVGVVFCDIDNFKRINDSLGHQAGDELLAALGRRLFNGLPEHCQAGRLNGDEFVIVCNNLPALGGLDRLLAWVTDFLHTVVPVRDQLVHVSASTGAATLTDTTGGDDLLRYADAALNHAKGKGPGHSVMAGPDLLASATDQLRLEDQLRTALDHDQLALHYQPITTATGTIVMAEALLRWPHPDRGLLSPGTILPIAEQAGLARELDQWVLRTATTQAAHWPDHLSVAVNLSTFTPDTPDFATHIHTLLTHTPLNPARLVLEMVETALVDLSEPSHHAMTSLSEAGVRFALDDFGTGYSSLARLKDLPAHILKLDRRFVANLEHDPRDRAIATAVINLAHALGHHCIAEGIETPQQHHLLTHLNTDLYQGFHLHKPQPPEELPL